MSDTDRKSVLLAQEKILKLETIVEELKAQVEQMKNEMAKIWARVA